MPITFQRTTKTNAVQQFGEDSPFVSSSIQINVDASKSSSYPGYGTSWADISGNGYNYSLINGVTFDSANGGSLNFQNGATATSPNFGNSFSGDFTYEVWINPSSLNGNILSERDYGGWTVSLMGLVNGEVRIGGWTGGTSYIAIGTITTGTWYQIVMRYSSGTLSGYINGTLTNDFVEFAKQYPGSNYYIPIADSEPTNFGDGGAHYSGKISSVKFYNTGLSDAAILQNYNALKYRYIPLPQSFESKVTFTANPVTNDGTTAQRAGESAYQIKRDFPNSVDGLYWIKNSNINGGTPFQIYADMTTDGGGWTLILTNATSTGWTTGNAIHNNDSTPSLSSNYSIVDWANYIKRSPSGFQYMMEAETRGNWGGIWTANGNYSFVNTDNTQTDVTLNIRFGNWDYANDGVEQRMPWYSADAYPTLTTNVNGGNDGAWWGTLVTTDTYWPTAPWMYSAGQGFPSKIWYWVR